MKFELAISTMYQTKDGIINLIERLNINCDCIIINQCNENLKYTIDKYPFKVSVYCCTERGLSRSRNMAINLTTADILLIGDDDLQYYDKFENKILDFYDENPNIDIAIFNMDDYQKVFPNKNKKCNLFSLSGFISMQVSFKVDSVRKKGIRFNEKYGTGSGVFNSGEENIFLANCCRRNLKIFYCKNKILQRPFSESTWDKGFSDKKTISDRGAIYYAMYPRLFIIFIIRYALKYKNYYKPYTFLDAIKFMNQGCKKAHQYKSLKEDN